MKSLAILFFLIWALPAFSESCEPAARQLLALDSEQVFKRIKRAYPPLPEEEQRELLLQYAETGDEQVLHKLVLHNLGLVSNLVLRYRRRHANYYMDLIQEGSIALLEAVKRYDLEKGVRFPTYASHYILGYIKRYADMKTRLVQMKVHPEKQKLFREIRKKLTLEGETVYDNRERIAKQLKLSVKAVMAMDFQLRENVVRSMDEPLSTSSDKTLAEIMPDTEASLADGFPVTDPIFKKHLAKFLKNYSARDRDIFFRRHFTSSPLLYRELAPIYGIDKSTVRRIERNMFAALKEYINSFERN